MHNTLGLIIPLALIGSPPVTAALNEYLAGHSPLFRNRIFMGQFVLNFYSFLALARWIRIVESISGSGRGDFARVCSGGSNRRLPA
jgi:hypothetical protein